MYTSKLKTSLVNGTLNFTFSNALNAKTLAFFFSFVEKTYGSAPNNFSAKSITAINFLSIERLSSPPQTL